MPRKPVITTKCPANTYARANQRIVEVSRHDGAAGCLISIEASDDGKLVVSVYRADTGVIVTPVSFDK